MYSSTAVLDFDPYTRFV